MDGIDKLDTMEDWKVLGRSIEIARLLAMNVHMAVHYATKRRHGSGRSQRGHPRELHREAQAKRQSRHIPRIQPHHLAL